MGARSHLRRIERRLGRRARPAPGDARARQRHRRIDSRALGALRHRRLQADLRARQHRPGSGRSPARSTIPGPMARTPADAALLLEVIAGWDPADSATVDVPLGDLAAALANGLEGRVVGVCPDMHLDAAHAGCPARLRRHGRGGRVVRWRASRRCASRRSRDCLPRLRRHAAGRGAATRTWRPGSTRRAQRSTGLTCAAGSRPLRARAFATTCAPPRSARACAPRSRARSRRSTSC